MNGRGRHVKIREKVLQAEGKRHGQRPVSKNEPGVSKS